MTNKKWFDFDARRTWALLVAVVCLAMVAGGFRFYQIASQRIRLEKCHELAAIGQLKTDQIAQWRQERLDDVIKDAENPFFRKAAVAWLNDSANLTLRNEFLQRLKLEQTASHYTDALLLDPDGRILLAAKDDPGPVEPATVKAAAQAIAGKQAVLSDLYRTPQGDIYLDAVAHVTDANGQPVAVVVLRTDAKAYLYPLIQAWPIPSQSAETLLVKKEGDEVLFLNDLRYQPGAALSLRIPLTRGEVPSVQAVQGKTAMFEGKDYRGVEVLADLKPVPDSPWFMVAKVNSAEILAEVDERAWISAIFVALFVLLTTATVAFLYRQRQVYIYRALHASERDRHKAEELLRATLVGIGDGVISTDEHGRVVFINPVAQTLTGWPHTEAHGKSLSEVFHIVNAQTRQCCENPVEKVLASGQVIGLANHTLLIARDGTEYQIADSGAPIHDGKGNVIGVVLVFRDVIEEYRIQEALYESEKRLAEAQKIAQLGTWIWDVNTGDVQWSEELFAIFHLDPKEFTPRIDSILALSPWPEDHERNKELIQKATQTHTKGAYEQRFLRPDGSVGHYSSTFQGKYDDDGNLTLIVGTVLDITERKRSEEILRASEMRYRRLFESAKDGILILDAVSGMVVDVNPFLVELLGLSYEQFQEKTIWELGLFDDILANEDHFLELQQEEYIRYEDVPLETADGRRIDVEFVSNVYLVDNGKIIQCNIRDISARKRAEAEAEVARDYIANIVNAIGDPVFVKDNHHRFVLVNDAQCALIGHARAGLIGKSETDFFPREQVDVFLQMDRQVLSTGSESINEEAVYDARTGEMRTIVTRKTLYVDPGGNRFIVGVSRDITERKQVESVQTFLAETSSGTTDEPFFQVLARYLA